MTLTAIFALIKRRHDEILFFFNNTCFLGKQPGMAALAGKILAEVELMFKNNRPDRLDKNNGSAAILLGPGRSYIAYRQQQQKENNAIYK